MLNNKIIKVFAFISLIMLFFFLSQLWKEFHPSYLPYQKDFKNLLIQKAAGEFEIDDFRFGVRQRWVEKLNRADRCETCHLGIEDSRFNDAPQPFKTHPDVDRHPIENFGCTVCHGGWPMATTLEKSHGPTENWEKAIYHENFLQKSCSQCHGDYIQDQAPVLAKGREAFKKLGCRGCHKVKGIERVKTGPQIKNIGSKAKKDWVYRWLLSPKGMISNAKMPEFNLTDQMAADMTRFLFSRTRSKQNNNPVIGSYGRGKKIFNNSQCVSCHPIRGRGADDGPDLGKISSKVNSQWLFDWIKSPKAWRPNTKMPNFGFSDQEIQDLVTFLAKEYTDPDLKMMAAEKQLKMIETADEILGKELISEYGCTGCHEIEGVDDQGETGLELTAISDMHRSKIDFGILKASYKDRTVPNWLYNKMKYPLSVGRDPKMPDFGFSDKEAEAMTTYLLSLTADEVPSSYKLPFGNPPSNYAPQGAFGKILDQYQCFTCHMVRGKGAEHGPDLTAEGSRIQRGWLEKFLKEPFGIRPAAHEKMPNFRLSDSEIDSIYSYFRTTLVDDRVEALAETVGKIDFDEPMVEAGRKLYDQKYACVACHRINSKGGMLGPDLSRVGDRLRPEWIAYHLQDPKAFVKNSPEPVYNFTENEIKELTAFLYNQKEND